MKTTLLRNCRHALAALASVLLGFISTAHMAGAPASAPSIVNDGDVFSYVDGIVLVHPLPSTARPGFDVLSGLQSLYTAKGFKHLATLPLARGDVGMHRLSLPAGVSVREAIRLLKASGLVQNAYPDYAVPTCDDDTSTQGAPDPFLGSGGGQYHLDKIHAIDSFDLFYSGVGYPKVKTGAIIAVIDTGLFIHDDFYNNGTLSEVWVNPSPTVGDVNGINFAANPPNGDISEGTFHGTFVSGVAAARGYNGNGGSGVAVKAKIMAIKALIPGQNLISPSAALSGIYYAVDHGASVINMSFGGLLPRGKDIENYNGSGQPYYPEFKAAIAYARDHQVIVVCAAGNDNQELTSGGSQNLDFFPATYRLDNILVVGATDEGDNRAGFSNYGGGKVHLAAPGTNILSTYYNSSGIEGPVDTNSNDYRRGNGTSFSAPQVAAVVLLMKVNYPTAPYQDIRNYLLSMTTPLPSLQGITTSGGLLNMYQALPH